MQLISKFNRGLRFLLRGIVIYSKYVWVIPLKDKNGITIIDIFQIFLDESNANQKTYGLIKAVSYIIDQWSLGRTKNYMQVYSTYNEDKSIIAERFIRTLKAQNYKCMTSISKKFVYWKIRWYSQ